MSAQVLRAPAKVTLSLRITGRRADGYHLIDAEMVLVSWFDELRITDTTGRAPTSLRVIDERLGTSQSGSPDDLICRALESVGRTAQVELIKRIPPGAGLGGGSADAAAVLRWAGSSDLVAAASLGADVPFCLVGGRANVRGIGERVEPLEAEPRWLTLLTPPLHCSTPVVYARWDDMGGPQGERGNDLEPAALAAYPELARWRDLLGDATGQQPRLAGSGSTWFVDGLYEVPDANVVQTLDSTEP